MKKFACAALLAFAFAVPAVAKDSDTAKAQREGGQTAEKASKQKARTGQDCDTNRAGVRCSRPKPKKVWFWGKA
jgi:opacity protein-like surface antigen